jgi:hypothetical protein
MIRAVRSFAHVPVQPRTLFVIDLDDTTWKYRTPFVPGRLSEWKEHVYRSEPELTDPVHFPKFLERVQLEKSCHILFLTARDAEMSEVTQSCIKRFVHIPFHAAFTSGQPKGPVLRHLFSTYFSDCDHVVFVDDLIENIESVQQSVPNAFALLYLH